MIRATIVILLATAGAGLAQTPPAVGVAAMLIGVTTHTVSSLYTGDRARDPFLPAAMGVSNARRVEDAKDGAPEAVDIHAMILRGLLKDSLHDYAIFSSEGGGNYMLRAGKFYNDRNKLVPGISGRIKLKQKTVELVTAEKDVQVFRLGEEEKEKEKP